MNATTPAAPLLLTLHRASHAIAVQAERRLRTRASLVPMRGVVKVKAAA